MDMTYDDVLAMPNNYVAMDQDEMTYIEGGVTKVKYGTAGSIRRDLNVVISLCLGGNGSSVVLGAAIGAIGGPGTAALGAAIGFFGGDSWFGNVASYARGGHNQVEGIIRKYGTSVNCKMVTTWSTINLTGLTVSLSHSGGGRNF